MTYNWEQLKYQHIFIRTKDLTAAIITLLIEHEVRFDLVETFEQPKDNVDGIPIILE